MLLMSMLKSPTRVKECRLQLLFLLNWIQAQGAPKIWRLEDGTNSRRIVPFDSWLLYLNC